MKRVAVTSLCEFAARRGDLDFRYTPAPSARQGIAGHERVRRRRGSSYQAEYPLEGQCEGLLLGGRADGYDEQAGVLEEIKTYRGNLERVSAAQQALHWAQLRVYGALLCAVESLDRIELKLTYFEVSRGEETCFSEQGEADSLRTLLAELCRDYHEWHRDEQHHRSLRDEALSRLKFPFDDFRPGQRELAESVFKSVCLDTDLLLQAPTGIGKTVATLFPALMAVARGGKDRVYYLTSRNTVRALALDALARIKEAQPERLPLRVMEFSSRTQSCEHPDSACHGDSCSLARGFFDRLPAARAEAVKHTKTLDLNQLRQIGLTHEICPYYLAQEMTRWCDVVIADVNRFFDQAAILHALTQQNGLRVVLLLDEAHNLIDRARAMYSAGLSQRNLLALQKTAPTELRKPLQRFARGWTRLIAEHDLNVPAGERPAEPVYLDMPPAEFSSAAQGLAASLTDYLVEQSTDVAVQELLFEVLAFLALTESFAEHSLCRLSRPRRGRASLRIENLVPADFLAPRFEAAKSSILFSATLKPERYYLDLLGLDRDTNCQAIGSPFSAQQLELRLARQISTRFKDREASVEPIADLLQQQYLARPANYLIYFSSFAYLESVYERFIGRCSDIPAWRQFSGMDEQSREAFLARFQVGGRGIGFAVLGGAFAEGIDLPGSRLSGVFITTLGLPPFDDAHRRLSNYLESRYGQGYEYTWLYPGMQKVAQAAGRVIRTPDDRGVIVLIDDRFSRPEIQALWPDWWPSPNILEDTGG